VRGEEVRAAARAVASAADWEADFVERAQRPARGGRGRKGVWIKSGTRVAFPAPCKGALDIRMLKCEYACAPPSKSTPPKGACKTKNIKFRSTLFEGTDTWRLHDAISLVAACYPLAVGGERGCE
jgi:hypothetical protein